VRVPNKGYPQNKTDLHYWILDAVKINPHSYIQNEFWTLLKLTVMAQTGKTAKWLIRVAEVL